MLADKILLTELCIIAIGQEDHRPALVHPLQAGCVLSRLKASILGIDTCSLRLDDCKRESVLAK